MFITARQHSLVCTVLW